MTNREERKTKRKKIMTKNCSSSEGKRKGHEQDARRHHKDSGTLALPIGCSGYIRSEQGSGLKGDDILRAQGRNSVHIIVQI